MQKIGPTMQPIGKKSAPGNEPETLLNEPKSRYKKRTVLSAANTKDGKR